MNTPLAYLDGRFLPFAEAGLPLHDAGFVSGATIVDNARTFRHALFRWPDHLARFRRDCRTCYVPLEASDEQITAAAEELIAHNARLLPAGRELQLVTFATPGPLGLYLGETGNGPPTLGMATYPLPFGRYRRFFEEGATLAIAGTHGMRRDDILPPAIKHRSRLAWHRAERLIHDPMSPQHCPGAVPVLVSPEGVGDTAVGCVLAVVEDAVLVPVAGSVLESVSAKVAAELCHAHGLRCEEAFLDLREVAREATRATELILAGTGFCLAGVRQVADGTHRCNFAWPGPIFGRLLTAWSELVGLDIAEQFNPR